MVDSIDKSEWYEIHGFASPSEFKRFTEYLDSQVRAGLAKEVPADPNYGAGEIFGGRWFQEVTSGQVWRLVPPDFPFKGMWAAVRQ